ncbi:BREX protein BrxB domain-containing protein [Desulfotignum balticum]|uniref:BREX protein BrxB domain-containing protein n=1 Tax=Desulfotignum balticum TaxID=115781 RepID=UPI00040B7589|nr:BREX protein BrxB domain-containing protein [Desulfotignum balticum]
MSKIKRLIQSYSRYIEVPWREDAAAAQRVIFCVYDETDERRLRAGIDEFEIVTRQAGYGWIVFDLTDTFAAWMASQRYAKSYFQNPHLLPTLLPRYLPYIAGEFQTMLEEKQVDADTVVVLKGVGSLFGFLKVKELVDHLAPMVKGRLLIFFPGSFENNNYRLLDGYDGWNYLAVPITADKVF